MTTGDFDLASLDEDFANAVAPERAGPTPVPDGRYLVSIDNVNLVKSKTSGEPMLAFELVIIEGDPEKRKLFRNMVLNHKTLSFAKRDLAMLGWVGKLSELEDFERRKTLLDIQLEVNVKSKGQDSQGRPNVNVYFDKLISKGAVTGEPTPF